MKTNAQRVAPCGGASVLASRDFSGERRLAVLPARGHTLAPPQNHNRGSAFTLLEVMIACGIFFIAIFAILGLVSNCLRNARALRHIEVDAGMVAAQLYKTNRLTEGVLSGDFGDTYRGYTWETATQEAATNGLYQVDIVVRKHGLQNPIDTMSVWIYSPESASTPFNRSPFSNPRR